MRQFKQETLSFNLHNCESSDDEENLSISSNNDKILQKSQHDFRALIQGNNLFVDKTLFIKSVIKYSTKTLIISRPKKWGKSLALNTLKYFLDISVDQNGAQIVPSPNQYLFTRGNVQIIKNKGLEISKQIKLFGQYQGKVPTIFMTLHCKQSKEQQVVQLILNQVQKSYKEKKYIIKSNVLREQYLSQMDKLKECKKIQNYQILTKLGELIQSLAQMLYNYHQKRKVYILIDDFDGVINTLIAQKVDQTQCVKIVKNFNKFFKNFAQKTQFVQKTVMIGTFDSLMSSTTVNIDNADYNNLLSQQCTFHQDFGFSQTQIEQQLLRKLSFYDNTLEAQIKIEKLKKRISSWYNGYTLKDTKGYKNIYNPSSVMMYIDKCTKNKLILKGKDCLAIEKIDQILFTIYNSAFKNNLASQIFQIILTPVHCFQNEKQIQQIQMPNLIQVSFSKKMYQTVNLLSVFNMTSQALTYTLIHLGYINGRTHKNKIQACIPNKQVRNHLRHIFQGWNKKYKILDLSHINIMDKDHYCKQMKIAYDSIKNSNLSLNQRTFHSVFYSRYLFSADPSHSIGSQVYSGLGWIDNIYYPNKNTKQGRMAIIIQFKYTETKSSVFIHQQAIWQIIIKGYLQYILDKQKYDTQKLCGIILRSVVIRRIDRIDREVDISAEQSTISLTQAKNIVTYFQQMKVQDIKSISIDKLSKYILQIQNVTTAKQFLNKIRSSKEGTKKINFIKEFDLKNPKPQQFPIDPSFNHNKRKPSKPRRNEKSLQEEGKRKKSTIKREQYQQEILGIKPRKKK